jgi:hypothetical protein
VTDNEIDEMLTAFQRACEMVVVRGDSHISETTKERAILRNEIRRRVSSLATELRDLHAGINALRVRPAGTVTPDTE